MNTVIKSKLKFIIPILCVFAIGITFLLFKTDKDGIYFNNKNYGNNMSLVVQKAKDGDTIYLSGNISIDKTIYINKNITLKPSKYAKKIKITANEFTSPLFSVSNNATFTIKGNNKSNIEINNKTDKSTIINLDQTAKLNLNKKVKIAPFTVNDKSYIVSMNSANNKKMNLGIYSTDNIYKTDAISDISIYVKDISTLKQSCSIGSETYDTLEVAIQNAKNGDTITLDTPIYLDNTITVDKNISIDGKDSIFMLGEASTPTFLIKENCSLNILQDNLHISGSNANVAILNNGNLTFNNITLDGDYSYGVITNNLNNVSGINTSNVKSSDEKISKDKISVLKKK